MKADDTKPETLQFKVTEQERKLIEKCAADEGTTISKYVRGAVLMSMVYTQEVGPDLPDETPALREGALVKVFAMLLLVSGNWHSLAKLETELKKLGETAGLTVSVKRTEPRGARTDMVPYSIDVVCLDQTGIVTGLSGFFSSRAIDIAELSTRVYAAAHTGASMFSVQMIVNVPTRIHLAQLREEFMDFCDSLNLDAIMEPVKS